jgi:hypothetical protein
VNISGTGETEHPFEIKTAGADTVEKCDESGFRVTDAS